MSQNRALPYAFCAILGAYTIGAVACGSDFTTDDDDGAGATSPGGGSTGGSAGSGAQGAGQVGGGGAGGGGGGTGGSAGQAGQGGQGGSGCVPTDLYDCYTGPPGTEGVGPCIGGKKECLPDGLTYGPCLGEVTPAAEICDATEDENCNGYDECLEPMWARGMGGVYNDRVFGLSLDSAGNMYVLGTFGLEIDFGNGVVATMDGQLQDIFLVKFDATGNALWTQVIGSTSSDDAGDLVTTAAGDVIVAGFVGDSVTVGSDTLTTGLFAAKFDTDGNVAWATQVIDGTLGSERITQLAMMPSGHVVGVGWGAGLLFGLQAGWQGGVDAFLVIIDTANGEGVHGKFFGSTANEGAYSVAVTPAGKLVIGGSFEGNINIVSGETAYGGQDMFVLEYDHTADPNVQWCVTAGEVSTTTSQDAQAVALHEQSGDVLVTGYFEGETDFGGGALTANSVNGDMFLARYGATGSYVGSTSLGDSASVQRGRFIAVDGDQIFVAGETLGAVSTGGFSLGGAGGEDVMLIHFDGTLSTRWGRSFGTTDSDYAGRLALDGQGFPLLAASVYGPVDLGSTLGVVGASNQQVEILLVKYAP